MFSCQFPPSSLPPNSIHTFHLHSRLHLKAPPLLRSPFPLSRCNLPSSAPLTPSSDVPCRTAIFALSCAKNNHHGSAGSAVSASGFEAELDRLLELLPDSMRAKLREHPEFLDLIEVVMDLGRRPLARFPSGDFFLSETPVNFLDLQQATSLVGDFADDNRAGISRTLHRVSAIRNRKGVIVGLTCRVGRAVTGSANMVRDLVKDGASLLLIGPPGVGKTTLIREIARMLADDYSKRVMIVDTSNEIGGDGDIPHAGIGGARRMQVPNADMQHKVLIEAVENHMPQVIVIDEIGTKLEALAASTIAQRGIQLVATAHGVTFENLVMNPSLDILVGGIQSVTLGDEEATRRGVQKSILERKGPATFNCGVEIMSKTELRVHRNLEETVDSLLAGRFPTYEVRCLNAKPFTREGPSTLNSEISHDATTWKQKRTITDDNNCEIDGRDIAREEPIAENTTNTVKDSYTKNIHIYLYVYGLVESNILQALKLLQLEDLVNLTDDISKANALLALQSKLKNSRIQGVARSLDIPIHATKSSSATHITKAINKIMSELSYDFDYGSKLTDEPDGTSPEKVDALEEARLAIEHIVIPKGQQVELLPRPTKIIAMQMDLVKSYRLSSEKVGKEHKMRLRILPYHGKEVGANEPGNESENDVDTNSTGYTKSSPDIDRLPILPN
ncbi:protein SEEDLING PLASTID DEVELOPMENT 1 isoform X1 [Nymphaea colorata]|nr:protein SEEDLING PLASTID DEVELOPMENT 1 isoform X1 [Nymphaea colorata]